MFKATFKRRVELGDVIQDLTYGWNELSLNPIQIHEISGTHETILFKPHVADLADSLSLAIEKSLWK